MNHDHCTVLACKVYLYVINIYNTDLASSKGFAAYGHFLAFFIFHADIYGVRMNICFLLIWSEREFQTFFMSNIKRISDAHIISRESHNTTQQSSVSTVTMVSFCKRAVQDEVGSL